MWPEMMRMSEPWHGFYNRKEVRHEEKAPSVMVEGRREPWEVKSKELVTESETEGEDEAEMQESSRLRERDIVRLV